MIYRAETRCDFSQRHANPGGVAKAVVHRPYRVLGVSDPLSAGFVPSMARPGGNITGFSNFEYAISGKWLELLNEIAPGTKRVAVLQHRDDAALSRYWLLSKH